MPTKKKIKKVVKKVIEKIVAPKVKEPKGITLTAEEASAVKIGLTSRNVPTEARITISKVLNKIG